jgi:hypothetical protein
VDGTDDVEQQTQLKLDSGTKLALGEALAFVHLSQHQDFGGSSNIKRTHYIPTSFLIF